MTDFAHPLAKLMENIPVAASPTGGLGLTLDTQGKVPLSALPFKAIAFGSSTASFAASNDAGTITLSNLFVLRNNFTSGGYYTPTAVFATSSSVSGHQTHVGVESLTSGGATLSVKVVDGTAVTGTATFYYLMIA